MQPKITPTFKDTLAEGTNTNFGVSPLQLQQFASGYQNVNIVDLPKPPEVPHPARPLRVALVGTAPSSRDLAPYNDPDWQIWACSPGNMGVVPKADAWFELHDNLDWPEFKPAYGEKYVEWLKTLSIPVFMQNQRLVPGAKTFPKDEIIKFFGKRCECFFGSSFVWMIALAIMSGAKEIRLYGVDMASPGEYATQRLSFYYWLEKAEDRGIIVDVPYESDLMIAPALYGYDEVTPEGRKLMARWQEIKTRIAQGQQRVAEVKAKAQAEIQQHEDFVKHLNGAAEDMEYHVQINMSHRHLTPNPSPV